MKTLSTRKCVPCQRVAAKDHVFKPGSGCKAVRYCGQRCQKFRWNNHKRLCQLCDGTSRNTETFASIRYLTPKQHVAVAHLVGEKCKVSCVMKCQSRPFGTQVHRCTGIHYVGKLALRISALLKAKEY